MRERGKEKERERKCEDGDDEYSDSISSFAARYNIKKQNAHSTTTHRHTYLLCLGRKASICEMFSLNPMARRVSASSSTRTSRDRKSNTSHLG